MAEPEKSWKSPELERLSRPTASTSVTPPSFVANLETSAGNGEFTLRSRVHQTLVSGQSKRVAPHLCGPPPFCFGRELFAPP